ncbi:ABC transporter ATP-binding protein [Microbacterium resistens]|uniref:ABC transporter ATP-binding protein n=1 Tax=Microbacterium resistens TaxID=156977 RepID=UPI001E54B75E|nr:ATP-binding cassette domain-containing protein [Microbacterium resistens]
MRELSLTHAGENDPSPHDLTADIRPGEVVLLLGPSGSGKSTFTLALNGLIPHSVPAAVDGTVEIAGHDTATTPVAVLSTRVSMVFQDPDAQLVTGSVLDEVAFALENLRLPVDQVLSRSERALRRLGLWERRAENPDRLSGGGRQRLAIAAAVAMQSPICVLDEPTANLDPAGAAEVYAALRDLAADGDRAIVLVEHDLDAAIDLATRVIVLDQSGRPVFDGPPAEILRAHADELAELGVWLPTATLLARRLRARGVVLDPLPLTADDLRTALASSPSPSVPPSPSPSVPPSPSPSVEWSVSVGSEAGNPQKLTTRQGAQEDALIRVRGLDVVRGRTPVLRGVDLDVASGSITAVVGPNGSGKTTLVQAIAGVVPPPRGRIRVADLDPATATPRDLTDRIGFVFQNPEHQFVAASVFDELAHGLRVRRVPADEIRARVTAMLARFGLERKAQVHPFLLSGGEKRRLSVGTALITRPRVLVLDEPTFGQDRARAAQLLALLHELRDEGTTILLVTHDHALVAEHATHVVVMDGGRVRAAGTTAELLQAGPESGFALPAALAAVPAALHPLLEWSVSAGSTALNPQKLTTRRSGTASTEGAG